MNLQDGTIQVYFQAYMRRAVFEPEVKRLELLDKLNRIDGISLPQNAITKYPSIPLQVFSDPENLMIFFLKGPFVIIRSNFDPRL